MKGKVLGIALLSLLATTSFAANQTAKLISHRVWTTGHGQVATVLAPAKAKLSLLKYYNKHMKHQGMEDLFAAVFINPVGEVTTNAEVDVFGEAASGVRNGDSKQHKYKINSSLCSVSLDRGVAKEDDCVEIENIFIIDAYGYLDFDQDMGLKTTFSQAGYYAALGFTQIQRDDKNVIYNTVGFDLIVVTDPAPPQ